MLSGYWPQISFVAIFGTILYYGFTQTDESLPGQTITKTVDESGDVQEVYVEKYPALVSNMRKAFLAIVVVYCTHRMMQPNIYQMFKPYHRIWRVFANICYAYFYLLIFIFMMNPGDARWMWHYVQSSLGTPVDKGFHTYDDDCEITWYNLLDNMDHYFLAHFTNWFLAAVILRDPYMLHFWSILDEILELSAQYKLPHFRECWWDHVFHDVLITNTPGIILGLKFVDMIGLQKYDWLGRKGKKSISEWRVFNDFFRFGGVIQIFFIISANFLCGFFMINSLWIPPLSIPNVVRMYIWFLLGNIVFKEGYNVITKRDNPATHEEKIEPTQRWVVFGIVLFEIAISVKFEKGAGHLQDDPMSPITFYGWLITFIILGYYYIHLRWIRKTDKEFEVEAYTPSKRTPRKVNGKKTR